MARSRRYSVYILTNKHHTVLYTGVTGNLGRRVREHKEKLTPGFRWCSAGVLLKNGKIRLNTSFWYLFEPIYSPCPVIFWQTGDLNRELQGKIAVFRPNTAINNNTPLEQHQDFPLNLSHDLSSRRLRRRYCLSRFGSILLTLPGA